MIPMTPSSSGYGEEEGAGEEGTYWPSVSPGVPVSTSGDEGAGAKVRKPYTITKQRERWTEEEHQKFLEALKLYGRAWRRIEEHIGTKTAVQIRSHAQKFFSKVEREATAGAGVDTGASQVIDIPPPRPKRKPTHPYPRKAGGSFGKTIEEENLLAAVGSLSSSSGISTANIAEGCVKGNSTREQDDSLSENCDEVMAQQSDDNQDDEKEREGDRDSVFTRQWGKSRTATPATVVEFPVGPSPPPHHLVATLNTGMQIPNNPERIPVSIPSFQAAQWGRYFPGGYNPGLIQPQAMMMPWVVAPSTQTHEDNGAAAAVAATIAAASAWWAMQGAVAPGVIHPTMGAFYSSVGPPVAIPTPYLFPQARSQEDRDDVRFAACGDGKETPPAEDLQDVVNVNESLLRSSAVRRAERALRVKELKSRRMGSGSHLISVSSDISGSSWGISPLNRYDSAGQVTVAKLASESASNRLSKGMSLPIKLNKVKSDLSGLVRKEREPLLTGIIAAEVYDKRKRARSGLSTVAFTQGLAQTVEPSGGLSAPLEKVRSVSGSNKLLEKFPPEEVSKIPDQQTSPPEVSSASDGNSDPGVVPTDDNASLEGGPSSNSSACGNLPGGNDRCGSSDGYSDGEVGEGPSSTGKEQVKEKSRRNVPDAEKVESEDEKKELKNSQCNVYNEFLTISKDGEKHEKHSQDSSLHLPRTFSLEGERKDVKARGQIAFQALFTRETLPRTFSPPPKLTLSAGDAVDRCKASCHGNLPNKPVSFRDHTSQDVCSEGPANDGIATQSSHRASLDQDSAFNTWQPLKCSASAKHDRCESSISMSSSRITNLGEDICLPELNRGLKRKERSQGIAINWLQLGTDISSLEQDQGAEDQELCKGDDSMVQEQEKLVCTLNSSKRGQNGTELDDVDRICLDLTSKVRGHTLSLSIAAASSGTALSSVSSTGGVKYSGVGFVPYQRASLSEPYLKL